METLQLNKTSSADVTICSQELFRQGIEYIKSDRNSEALVCFKKIFETEGYVPGLCYSSAVALIKLGKVEDAILACQSEIAHDPDHRDAPAHGEAHDPRHPHGFLIEVARMSAPAVFEELLAVVRGHADDALVVSPALSQYRPNLSLQTNR